LRLLAYLETARNIRKITVAFKDVNHKDELEIKIPAFSKELQTMREVNVAIFHYIKETDSEFVKMYKLVTTLEKLEGLSPEYQEELQERCGGGDRDVRTAVLDYYKTEQGGMLPSKPTLSIEEKKNADDWWLRFY
jgi:hypothetical protein